MVAFAFTLHLLAVPPKPTDPLLAPLAARAPQFAADLAKGRFPEVHSVLRPILETGTADQRRGAEVLLRKVGVHSTIEQMIVDLRIQSAIAGRWRSLPPPGPKELPLLLQPMVDRLDLDLRPVDEILARANTIDPSGARMDDRLGRMPEMLDHCRAAANLLPAVRDVLRRNLRSSIELKPDLIRIAERDFNRERIRIEKRSDRLLRRMVELCLLRIPDHFRTLERQDAAFTDRLRAVERLEAAFAMLHEYWKRYAEEFPTAAEGGLASWRLQERRFKDSSGPLRQKAWLLNQGKQWWLRGRFGKGELNGGIAKGTYGATRAQQLDSLVRAPLLMPDPIPRPADPQRFPRPEPIARRHMEAWNVVATPTPAPDADTLTRRLQQRWRSIPAPDGEDPEAMIRRIDWRPVVAANLVGFVEYQMALLYWERLVASCTDKELKAIDEMAGDDDRCIVHSYVSRRYNDLEPASSLRFSPPKADDPRAQDPYERRGLSWCMALAKIELAGMRSLATGFERLAQSQMGMEGRTDSLGKGSNASIPGLSPLASIPIRPFDAWRPNVFDRDRFAELLWDGTRCQYYRLQQLRMIGGPEVAVGRSPSQLFATNRFALMVRMGVAAEMIAALRTQFGPALSPIQRTELATRERRIESSSWAIASSLRFSIIPILANNSGRTLGPDMVPVAFGGPLPWQAVAN